MNFTRNAYQGKFQEKNQEREKELKLRQYEQDEMIQKKRIIDLVRKLLPLALPN